MTFYSELIAKATGYTDPDKLDQIEGYMRHIYFHSTLNWQTAEELTKAAKESAADLESIGWGFR